jgi:hypothetical protein
MFRGITVGLVALFGATALGADDPKPPATLEAVIRQTNTAERPRTTLSVRLVGGKEATVITEGLKVEVVRAGKQATVKLTVVERKDEKGRPIVPSADKLGLVKLQPGEVALVYVPFAPDMQKVVSEAFAGEVTLVVEYEVPESWGKRFGAVSGKFSATASVTK